MEVRLFTENDYPEICKWWASWGWDAIPLESLPTIGLIAVNGKEDIYAAFLYKTDSDICWFDWFVGNKEAKKENRKGGLNFLIKEGATIAKQMGFSKVFCSVRHESVTKALSTEGFIETDKNMTNFVGII